MCNQESQTQELNCDRRQAVHAYVRAKLGACAKHRCLGVIALGDCFEGVALEDYVQFNWGMLWGCLVALRAVFFGECVAGGDRDRH